MAEKQNPDRPNLQGMIDDMRGRARRKKPETIGVCPTCHQTITVDNEGHLPECNHTEYPQYPPDDSE